MAFKHPFKSWLAFYPETTQGVAPVDWNASGTLGSLSKRSRNPNQRIKVFNPFKLKPTATLRISLCSLLKSPMPAFAIGPGFLP